MTDTQRQDMVGAYGIDAVDTPNLDRLAANGLRFDRAYCAAPVCTPARGAMFTGQHPQINGAWCNNVSTYRQTAMMGEIFREHGYRAGYTGKWHLDGTDYVGAGEADGGFEPDWWYDLHNYKDDIGDETYEQFTSADNDDLRAMDFSAEDTWGHRVADRAIDFLETVDDDPFILTVSFDEPHGPSLAPPTYRTRISHEDIPKPDNFNAPLDDKPQLQRLHREDSEPPDWESAFPSAIYGCNSYIDREIGRVIDAVDREHPDDTAIIYVSDHGWLMGEHGLRAKAELYEPVVNVPFIVRTPDTDGETSDALVNHLDILPTMLDIAGIDRPPCLHGESLRPIITGTRDIVRETTMVSYHRFAINHDSRGGFYPVRCLTDGRHKLVVNLFESDEFYDLATDPGETTNRIRDPAYESVRNDLHDRLLTTMDDIRDPFRTFRWGNRSWRTAREPSYRGGKNRPVPERFPFQKQPRSE